jgi:hypothetical protein
MALIIAGGFTYLQVSGDFRSRTVFLLAPPGSQLLERETHYQPRFQGAVSMRSTRKRGFSLALAGLLSGALCTMFALPSGAQTAESRPAPAPTKLYDAARETTINGTVEKVLTTRVGGPAGMHILVSEAHGTVDAHVGPYLSKSTKEALHMGLPLQMVGVMASARGKQVFLVRQLIYGGQTVNVRNSNGFLLRPQASGKKDPFAALNGGVR